MGHTDYYILGVTRKAFKIFRKYVKDNNIKIVPKEPWECESLHVTCNSLHPLEKEGYDDSIIIEVHTGRDYDREEGICKAIRHVVETCEESEYFTGSAHEGHSQGECKGKLNIMFTIWRKYNVHSETHDFWDIGFLQDDDEDEDEDEEEEEDAMAMSAFKLPVKISSEMCKFLNLDEGTKIPRREVTKMLCQWVKDHPVRNEEDKRLINIECEAAAPLKNIMSEIKEHDKENFSCFTMQKYIQHHYLKSI